MMIVILALGLLLALAARSARFSRRARFHRSQAYLGATTSVVGMGAGTSKTVYHPTEEGWWHLFMSYELETAAWRPWRLSDPEPPPRDQEAATARRGRVL